MGAAAEVGKRTLTAALEVQQKTDGQKVDGGAADSHVHAAAAHGVSGTGMALPHLDHIQRAFGRHDVGGVKAHVGGEAAEGAEAMGAKAFATGDRVAFAAAPDLHTAAHEAAHVVQQREGVQLKGGVGQIGDSYEQHADAVADAVVAGRPAESLLDQMAPARAGTSPGVAGGPTGVQRKNLQQHGLDAGLAGEGDGELSGYSQQGKVYGEAIVGDGTRAEALATAGAHSAALGQRIDAAKKGWTPDAQPFNHVKVGTLDPLLYKAEMTFGDPHAPERLSVVFQHAKAKTGYVVKIEDSTNPATTGGATMYEKADGPKRPTDKFSNEHDVAGRWQPGRPDQRTRRAQPGRLHEDLRRGGTIPVRSPAHGSPAERLGLLYGTGRRPVQGCRRGVPGAVEEMESSLQEALRRTGYRGCGLDPRGKAGRRRAEHASQPTWHEGLRPRCAGELQACDRELNMTTTSGAPR